MMPDISMCANKLCPLCKTCYRFMAIPDQYWQTYGSYEYKDDKCKYYWKLEHVHKIRKVEGK